MDGRTNVRTSTMIIPNLCRLAMARVEPGNFGGYTCGIPPFHHTSHLTWGSGCSIDDGNPHSKGVGNVALPSFAWHMDDV